jgi:hypothetical protein
MQVKKITYTNSPVVDYKCNEIEVSRSSDLVRMLLSFLLSASPQNKGETFPSFLLSSVLSVLRENSFMVPHSGPLVLGNRSWSAYHACASRVAPAKDWLVGFGNGAVHAGKPKEAAVA